MAKNLKLNIKNEQLAQAINLGNLKGKLTKNKAEVPVEDSSNASATSKSDTSPSSSDSPIKEEAPRIKARSRSAFAEQSSPQPAPIVEAPTEIEEPRTSKNESPLQAIDTEELPRAKSNAELRRQIFGEDMDMQKVDVPTEPLPEHHYKPKHIPQNIFREKESEEIPEQLVKPKIEASKEEQHIPERPSTQERSQERPPRRPQDRPPERREGQGYQGRTQDRPQERTHERRTDRPPQERSQDRPPQDRSQDRPPQDRSQERPQGRFQGERHGEPRKHFDKPTIHSDFQPKQRYTEGPRRPYTPPSEKLGPTGKHINDLIPAKPKPRTDRPRFSDERDNRGPPRTGSDRPPFAKAAAPLNVPPSPDKVERRRPRIKDEAPVSSGSLDLKELESIGNKSAKGIKPKEFRDIKPARKQETPQKSFDARDKHGLRSDEESSAWRRKKAKAARKVVEDTTQRPTSLSVRVPISVKDLASEMKLKASQLIAKLFMQGVAVTLNDLLDDETILQLLGQEFGCEINIDRREEDRIRITDKSIREEIAEHSDDKYQMRAPVVAFMGHVDHGKTSLIDAIRKSNRVSGEAGAITQHIGAFKCNTAVGDIAILDTPGHEAFSAMRARGADVTDIVVLVVAGDEGIRQQTVEAINHAKNAGVTIVVAINKSDKPNFNQENVYRQLSEHELLPEAWGGQTITVNCSAVTGEGISTLLEMLALQSDVLELKAIPEMRARGTVLESELHKGMGNVATVLIQNGTLKRGDAVVFSQHWGRIKTIRNEFSKELEQAGPSTPVEITGLSGLPEAGEEFIVVKSEKEAREIAEARTQGMTQKRMQQGRKMSMESMLQRSTEVSKKTLNLIIRADVQGSLEALRTALEKIHSEKVDLNIIMAGIGEVSESDVQMAETSKAAILGFHTKIEAHAEEIIKQFGIKVYLHDIIYHAIDQVKELMTSLLDKIPEEHERGQVEVKATFKSSQLGVIAGCQVTEGSIHRNHLVRVRRGKDIVWKGTISSLRRSKDDVREVQKGFECGVVFNGFNDAQAGDVIESYEIVYKVQEL